MKDTLAKIGGVKGKNFSPRIRNDEFCMTHTHPCVGRSSPFGSVQIQRMTSMGEGRNEFEEKQ
jgi:hypothetical protein